MTKEQILLRVINDILIETDDRNKVKSCLGVDMMNYENRFTKIAFEMISYIICGEINSGIIEDLEYWVWEDSRALWLTKEPEDIEYIIEKEDDAIVYMIDLSTPEQLINYLIKSYGE